ncbi:hypothetical protein Tco_0861393 [Tanacetum coccineum]|uniref:Uncharacterized protein n=1 Tax=Tanacetum coccineum TaxID=301880 RepID=A0ABQ5BI43_9ASTR
MVMSSTAKSTVMPDRKKLGTLSSMTKQKQVEMADTQAEISCQFKEYSTKERRSVLMSTKAFVAIGNESIHDYFLQPIGDSSLSRIVSSMAYVAHTTSAPALSSPSTPSPQPTAQSPNDALMATMTQIANLLSGFQKQFPPTNNQLRTSSNSRTHATVHDGRIVARWQGRCYVTTAVERQSTGKRHLDSDGRD